MSATLQQRVTGILTTPRSEWPTIAAEPETLSGLYVRYVMPLAAIGPIVTLLRGAAMVAVLQFAAQLIWLFISAKILEILAPKFTSTGDTTQAAKLVAYASTPGWLAGIALLVPWVGSLVVFAATVYNIYLFYLGLTPVMRTPSDQIIPFMVVAAIVMIVVSVALAFVTGPLFIGGMLLGMA